MSCGVAAAVVKPVTFLASFPPIQSAIKVAGDGGMRIQLDIPESEMATAVKLLGFRDVLLQVTVKEAPEDA